jgi:hypothetical protein
VILYVVRPEVVFVVDKVRTVLDVAHIGEVDVTLAVGTGITVTVVFAVTGAQAPLVTL